MHRHSLPHGLTAMIASLWTLPVHASTFLLSLDPASQPAEYHIDAGSNGRERIYLLQQSGSGEPFYFSVDRVAVGAPNTAVWQESAPPNESAAADIYLAGLNMNTLYHQESALGLDAGFFGDDIDALQIQPDPPGPPLPDLVVINAAFPYSSLWRHSALIGEAATINGAMPMADPDGLTPDDIVLSLGMPNLLFASGVTHIGLMAGDDLDALMLLDVTPDGMGGFIEVPNGILDPGLDLGIFSLDPFSPSTFTSGLGGLRSPGDLLITTFLGNYNVFRTAAQLGLLTDDNVDAVSMIAVPEPASVLLLLAGIVLLRHRRRERATFSRDPAGVRCARRGPNDLRPPTNGRGNSNPGRVSASQRGPTGLRLNVIALLLTMCFAPMGALALPGDADGDHDIDLFDVSAFQTAFTGAGGGVTPDDEIMDFDFDEDVDLLDFAAFREQLDGPAFVGNPCAALGPAEVWGGPSPPVNGSAASLEFKSGTAPDIVCFTLSATHPAPGINLAGMATDIVVSEQEADQVAIVPGAGGAPTRIVFSHTYVVPPNDVGAGSTVLVDADLLLSPYWRGVLDVRIDAPGGASSTVRYLIRPLIDLDIDSDNNSMQPDRAPQRDAAEETIEDDATMTGAILCVNDDDDDGDGVIDFGDGFDLSADTEDDDENAAEDDFVKMVLAIPMHLDVSVATIRVMYAASDPALAMIAGNPPGVTPAPGRLRIWTKRGSEIRDKASISNGGDYVSPAIHAASSFDFQLDAAAGQRKVELWVEGIRPSPSEGADRIEFAIDPDGPGPQDFVGKDAVRGTVVSLKFVETDFFAGASILPLFNPSPIVTLDPIGDPGMAEMVNINVIGTVKDYIAPIEMVRVNGAEVNVMQSSSGPDGLGPFEGIFNAPLALTGNTTLIEATAINSLKNVGKDSTLIVVVRDANFNIMQRMVTEQASVPPAPADEAAFLDAFRFKIRLEGLNPPANQLDVQLETGVEMKTITLTRPGTTGPLNSKDLFLCPENLVLPGGASADVQNTRIKADLGKRPAVSHTTGTATCSSRGITKGMLLRKKTDNAIADFVESAIASDVTTPQAAVQYEPVVGLHGITGAMIDVKARGLDNAAAQLAQPMPMTHFPPLEPTITLVRQSNDKTAPEYHLYKAATPSKPLMGVRTPLPIDNAGAPQSNPDVTAIWVEFDGALRCRYDPDVQVSVIEPVVGMEIVADRQAAPNIFKATGLIPVMNPSPPVISVADGAPRPIIPVNPPVIDGFVVTYMADAANPRRFLVQATVRDQLADLINGNTFGAVGIMARINGAPVPDGAVTINRPPNDPPRPFQAMISMLVDLENIPMLPPPGPGGASAPNDVLSYNTVRTNSPGSTYPAVLTMARQAIILEVTNAAGNRSWDSAFCLVTDTMPPPNPDGVPPFTALIVNDARRNPPTLYDVPPQLFFARYHNPFKAQNSVVQALSSRMGATQIATKPVVLLRKLAGNTYSFGPFAVPTTDRWVVDPPPIAATTPAIIASAYMHDANGLVTGEMIAGALRIDAPAPSREDLADTLPLDLRVSDQAAGGNMRDAFLPTGSDAMPTAVNITALSAAVQPAAGIPDTVRNDLTVEFRLKQVTNFAGYCTNAPQPGPPAPAGFMNDDFSFDAGGNDQGPTAAAAFDAMGEVRNTIQSKDFGGRAVLDGTVNIPGNAARSVLANVVVDDDGDFLSRSWERRFRNSPGVADPNNPIRDGLEDNEDRGLTGAGAVHNEKGDGFTALEEYRGVRAVPPGAPALPLARRVDEIVNVVGAPPNEMLTFDYGVPVTGTAANANLVAGPRVKDVFVLHQSTIIDTAAGNLAMGTEAAGLANLAWHKIGAGDLSVNPVLMTPAGARILTHNHQINFNGENDGLTTMQNAIHIRDNNGLGAMTRASSGSFAVDNIDVQMNAMLLMGWGFAPAIPTALANGRTVFHELGHKCSLYHCVNLAAAGGNALAIALTARNGTDFIGGDGIADGELRFTFNTYTDSTGTMRFLGQMHAFDGIFFNGVGTQGPPAGTFFSPAVPPAGGGRLVRPGTAAMAGTFAAADMLFSRTIRPELMDWTPYARAMGGGLPNGVQQQINGDLMDQQVFLPGPGITVPVVAHSREIRVRSSP